MKLNKIDFRPNYTYSLITIQSLFYKYYETLCKYIHDNTKMKLFPGHIQMIGNNSQLDRAY